MNGIIVHILIYLNVILFVKSAGNHKSKHFNEKKVEKWARELSKNLIEDLAKPATQVDELIKSYKNEATVESYDPENVLEFMVWRLTGYLEKRKKLAEKLRDSLVAGDTVLPQEKSFGDQKEVCIPPLKLFEGNLKTRLSCIKKITNVDYSFYDARPDEVYEKVTMDGVTTVSPFDNDTILIEQKVVKGIPNPNFYNLSVDTARSAVHVPTPIYKLKPELLKEIKWSGDILDKIFQQQRKTEFPAASWQFYCSKQGFMRFYPATNWTLEGGTERGALDLYDCRNSEWFIDGATNAKNVLILIDMSGSMFGQRYEIAKQTLETIFETLSENDFFNIITYSTEPKFILPQFNKTLIQATLRNKRLMKEYFNDPLKQPENQADLSKALELAFKTLLELDFTYLNWTADVRRTSDDEEIEEMTPEKQRELDEQRVLLSNLVTNKTEKLGCNSAIMLITDGATDFHTNIFNQYNPEPKKIRFFSFLIGNDVTAFSEVRQMACSNRGYFVHIANLADVQEKVQKYIEVMSRPVAKLNNTYAIWTGGYLDRMYHPDIEPIVVQNQYYSPSGAAQTKVARLPTVPPKGQRLVTTVAYAVVINSTFRGVVGASAPITELQQMAAAYMLGANAYSFLVDNNGYVMFHPQLRPWHNNKPKPNYNSMDIMELEVLEEIYVPRMVQEHFDDDSIQEEDQCDLSCYYKSLLLFHVADILYPQIAKENITRNDTDNSSKVPIPVNYHAQLRKYLVDGKRSKVERGIETKLRNAEIQDSGVYKTTLIHDYNILYAIESVNGSVRRVYPQENRYYFSPVNETLMTLGLAVPTTSLHRLRYKGTERNETQFNHREVDFPYKNIDLKWFSGNNWRMHPDWQYCRANDEDYMLTKEQVFVRYLEQIKNESKIPDKCVNYTYLINRLLFEAKLTCQIDSCWISKARLDARKGVHSVFLATEAGLTRYADTKLEDIMWEPYLIEVVEPGGNISYKKNERDKPYEPFIKRHTKGLDENFYRRAMRYKDGQYLFDVNISNVVYMKNDSEIGRLSENQTKNYLISVYRSVYLEKDEKAKAPIGVVGFEMLYTSLAEMVYNASGKQCYSGAPIRCYLIDEHGYMIYTSATNDTHLLEYYLGHFFGNGPGVDHSKYRGGTPPVPADRTESIVFSEMVKKKFYETLTYIDFQAMCAKDPNDAGSSARRLLSPLYNIGGLIKWLLREIALILSEYGIWNYAVNSIVRPARAYTATFRGETNEPSPCDKWSSFYFLNDEREPLAEDIISDEIQCQTGESCILSSVASRVPGTNLVLVILEVDTEKGSTCFSEMCVHAMKTRYTKQFGMDRVANASDKTQSKGEKVQAEARYRRATGVCLQVERDDQKKLECSGAVRNTNQLAVRSITMVSFSFVILFSFLCNR